MNGLPWQTRWNTYFVSCCEAETCLSSFTALALNHTSLIEHTFKQSSKPHKQASSPASCYPWCCPVPSRSKDSFPMLQLLCNTKRQNTPALPGALKDVQGSCSPFHMSPTCFQRPINHSHSLAVLKERATRWFLSTGSRVPHCFSLPSP